MFTLSFAKNFLKSHSFVATSQLFNKHNCQNVRVYEVPSSCYTTKINANKQEQTFINDKWHTIYALPLIKWISAFNKLKIYQLGIMTPGTPLAFALENSSYTPEQSSIAFLCLGITGLVTLSLGSLATRNLIGFVYINPDKNQVRISYVNFWGKRKESIHKIEDIINVRYSKLNLYQLVEISDTKSPTYKLIYRFSEIRDPHNFNSIFG